MQDAVLKYQREAEQPERRDWRDLARGTELEALRARTEHATATARAALRHQR